MTPRIDETIAAEAQFPAASWLDAPTCEGWWWFKFNCDKPWHDGTPAVFHVQKAGERLEAARPDGEYLEVGKEFFDGRWFGPLTPPEG